MDAYDTIGNFCEQKLLGRPEILNCISSLFIIMIPYWGLKYSRIKNFWIQNILQLLMLDGFTAFGYHWTGYYIFKHLDEIPMVISIWFGILMLIKEISKYAPKFKCMPIFVNIYFTVMLAINTVPKFNDVFAPAYAIICLTLIPLVIYYFNIASEYIYTYDKKNVALDKDTNITTVLKHTYISYQLFFMGTLICIISAVAWVLSETYCKYIFLLGHSFWHFGMPLGMYYIMLSIEYFQQVHQYKLFPQIKYKYCFFPIII